MAVLGRGAVYMLLPVFLTTGCLSTDNQSGQVDPRLEESSFTQSSYFSSCLIGGALGAFVGLATANDKATGLLVGAAGGCAAGMGSNLIFDTIRKDYKSKEEQLNATQLMLKAENEKLSNIVNLAHDIQKQQREELAKIDRAEMDSIKRQQEVKKLIADADANIESLRQNLKATEQIETDYIQVREKIVGKEQLSDAENKALKQLDERIAKTREQNAMLRKQIDSMVAQRNSMHNDLMVAS